MLSYSVRILIPLEYNPDDSGHRRGIPFAIRDAIIDKLIGRFGGVTLSECRGKWVDARGREIEDHHTAVDIDGLPREDVDWLLQRAPTFANRLQQDELFVRVTESTTHFIRRSV